jgi:glucuronate isomerase
MDGLNMVRLFTPNLQQAELASHYYEIASALPLVSPHGHVDPRLFSDANYRFGNPAELLISPDHYVFRLLFSQGVPLERLGIPRQDGAPVETDPRKIWQLFADYYYLFRGTPTGFWLNTIFSDIFGIRERLSSKNAQAVYDGIEQRLNTPAFTPRRLFEHYKIEVLCTTDAASDPLVYHQAIRESGWQGRILPTFRPDAVVNLDNPGWKPQIEQLSRASGISIGNYASFIQALENRRDYFKHMGATATDHGATSAYTGQLPGSELEALFQRALKDHASSEDARLFTGHMIIEFARMSVEDGLVMQMHVGSMRNHNPALFQTFGVDKGADIPVATEFTHNLAPLLAKFGSDPRLTLILFTLDESTYSRELAPLAGHYPALRLGPPWWFNDSPNGMARYLNSVMETAGIYNTAGFNDDTRAFLSIPVRHEVWRRVCADWLAGLVLFGRVDRDEAEAMASDLAYGLAMKAYRL